MLSFSARKVLLYLSVFVFAMALMGISSPPGRTALLTLSFLPEVLPNAPIRPLSWVTGDPVRQPVEYSNGAGYADADLYLPSEGRNHGAILLFLGVNPAGRNDPRVVGLGNALARTGIVTMIPWLDSMTQKRIDVDEIDNLVKAYQFLLEHERVDPERAGMAGFCVGASLAMVAAQDDSISDNVRFINFFGGYYRATDLIASATTGTRTYNGQTQAWTPNELTRAVVAAQLIEGVASQHERDILTDFSQRVAIPEEALLSLSKNAQAVYGLLAEPELVEVPALISDLHGDTLKSLEMISPSSRIGDLKAQVFIMHDRQDSLVPSDESRRLADALDPEQISRYTAFAFFQHLDPTRPVGKLTFIMEAVKLYWHLYGVFRELS